MVLCRAHDTLQTGSDSKIAMIRRYSPSLIRVLLTPCNQREVYTLANVDQVALCAVLWVHVLDSSGLHL